MAMRAPRICRCGHRIASGTRCPCEQKRDAQRKAAFDKTRPSASQRGYDGRWQRERKAFLALPENRLCACGCGRPADTVDHKIRHRGDQRMFWDRSNWQAMNSHCHNTKKQRAERRAAGGYP